MALDYTNTSQKTLLNMPIFILREITFDIIIKSPEILGVLFQLDYNNSIGKKVHFTFW